MMARAFFIAVALAAIALAVVVFVVLPTRDVPEQRSEETDAGRPAPDVRPPEPGAAASRAPSPGAAAARPGVSPRPAPVPPPAPTRATLHIDADVPRAQVFLDRRFIGTTPLVAENVAPGRRQLNASAEGFEGIAETIEVEPGSREITLKFREIRLDAAIDVVHRHRIGSCRGRLVADAQRLRYETTHAEDAFDVALTDVEVFEVDYLERNLRIRRRGGRVYNFTDPEDRADPLFVFHRDVEKARGVEDGSRGHQ